MPSEFQVIERYFAPLADPDPSISLGMGDDCALLSISQPTELAFSIDTLVEGVHFLPDIAPEDLAWRLLGSSVSDLAAMGAEPLWLTLALTLPDIDEAWLSSFSSALKQACQQMGIRLIGGDTTSGRCRVLSAQVHGRVAPGTALTRSGAQPGDLICVSGTLGDSRAGLALLRGEVESCDQTAADYLKTRYHRPQPRLALGRSLIGRASAAIDISDGFLADLCHLLKRSAVGASVDVSSLPISSELQGLVDDDRAIHWASTGGEDFELCFTLPETELASLQSAQALPISVVGKVVSGKGLELLQGNTPFQWPEKLGFDHFGVKS